MAEPGWESATFEGARRVTARAVATASPQRRWEWLEEALALAASCGTLALVRAERQRAALADWSITRER